jgi:mannose-1-phosphate guanylyltransferase/mannose-1-phosphate guanylyltransferase/mannose-6-phosphate isomerase
MHAKGSGHHVFEYRPWGYFEILKDTENFKSKVIRVNPHSQISYQSHAKREEHWTITQGSGEVVLNDEVIPVKPGTHIHIPLGAKHRIRNNTGSMLEFVEVQLGTYFGEDDIVRYQDDYQRK